MKQDIKFSVCVPVLNARGTWAEFSTALKNQTASPHEVLVLDSESDDGTAELAEQDGFRIVRIARPDFRHGATRQLAAEIAGNVDVLVYLTQDSLLASRDAISGLLRAFENSEVGAAYGRQLPRRGAGVLETHARLFNYPDVSDIRSKESISTLGFKAIFFSNSFGAYRRTALQSVGGFPLDVNFGEDTVVAARLILRGWKVAYVAEAQAFHSHDHTWREEFQRYKRVGALHAGYPWLLRDFGGTSGEGWRFVKSELATLLRLEPSLIPSAIVGTICKYSGYRLGRASKANRSLSTPEGG